MHCQNNGSSNWHLKQHWCFRDYDVIRVGCHCSGIKKGSIRYDAFMRAFTLYRAYNLQWCDCAFLFIRALHPKD